MVRELQKSKYKANYFSVSLDDNPDFIQLASAYGIAGEKVTQNSKVKDAINRALEWKGAYIL